MLNETFFQLTRPGRGGPVGIAEARAIVEAFARSVRVIAVDLEACLNAYRVVEEHSLSTWDALIWAAAKRAECRVLYSEDFQHGRELEGVVFHNPFLELD